MLRNGFVLAMLGMGSALTLDAAAQIAALNDGLEEIVVTAQRRSADVQKTPIPMTVISGEELAASGKVGLDDALRDSPSVQIQGAAQGADVVIRGVGGNDTGGISQDPDVSVFSDGVYNGQPQSNLGSLYDVNRIEVLRGPQGTLYGRNSAGGAINILTNSPEDKFGVGANVNIGNFSLRHVDGYVNIPLTQDLAVRVAVDREKRDGYYSNGGGEVDNEGARVKAKWTPTASFTLSAQFEFWRQQGLLITSAPVQNIPGPCGPPCFLFAAADPHDPWNTNVGPGSPFAVDPVGSWNRFYTYSMQADWDLGFGVLTFIPSYSKNKQDQSTASLFAPASATHVYPINTTTGNQSTYEVRLAAPAASAIQWVVGAYALDSHANQYGPGFGGAAVTWFAILGDNERPASSYAGFAQATIPMGASLRATLGARYTVDEKSEVYGVCSSTDGLTCGPSPTGAGTYVSPASKVKARYNSFTYKAGVEYDLSATAMGYAQVSTGYKAGGFSTNTNPPSPYTPEKLTDFEVGVKSRLLDNRLQVNGDIYVYQYRDQQIELHPLLPWTGIIPAQYIPAAYLLPLSDPNLPAAYQPILDINAGDSRYEGAEIQTKYQFTAHDQLSVEAAYNHAVYGNLVIETGGGPPGTASPNPTADLSGQQEAHAPRWNGSLGLQHVWDLGEGSLAANVHARFQSSSFTTVQEWFANGRTVQGGYHMTDFDLRYNGAQQRWNVGLWVKNIEDKAVVNYVYPLYKQTLDIGRTFGVNVAVKY